MKETTIRLGLVGLLAVGVLFPATAHAAGKPIIEGYADYDAYRLQLESIAASEYAVLKPLATTLGGRQVYLLEIGTGKRSEKPAILIVGSVEPAHLLGSELTVRLAGRLVEEAKTDKAVRRMLAKVTFYIIPRPAPDACEAFFRQPYAERELNERPLDDDGDGQVDEDPPEDLNADGVITMLRVADTSGQYVSHPDDDRVLIKADPKKNELGRWRLYPEGRDTDEDEQVNEDPAGGVAFNRNFTFRYPYFEPGAGPHQVSEPETRAVADFAFDHPNIAVVLTCTPEDNLMNPWKPESSGQSGRIKTSLLAADAPYFNRVAKEYREIHGGKNPPEPPKGEGSFSEWAYFHYGRWSFAFRGWWIPKVATEKDSQGKQRDQKEEAESKEEDDEALDAPSGEEKEKDSEKPRGKKRGAEDLNALRWFAREKIDGFVDWRPIEHVDFPGRKVEVGGFKPFLRLNPPESELEPLAETHWKFLRRLVELLPRPAVQSLKAESLGGNVWRVTAVVVNQGYLPTMSQMGRTSRQPQPLQIELELPDGASLVGGHPRAQLPTLAGEGGRTEKTWLVSAGERTTTWVRVRVWSPSVGAASKRVKLAENAPGGQKEKN